MSVVVVEVLAVGWVSLVVAMGVLMGFRSVKSKVPRLPKQ